METVDSGIVENVESVTGEENMNGMMKEKQDCNCKCNRYQEAKKNLEKAQKEYDEALKEVEPILPKREYIPYPVTYPWRYIPDRQTDPRIRIGQHTSEIVF